MKRLVWSGSRSKSLHLAVAGKNMNSYSAHEYAADSLRLGDLGRSHRIPTSTRSESAASGRLAAHADPVCGQLPVDGLAGPRAVPAISIAARAVAHGRPLRGPTDFAARPLFKCIFSACLSEYGP